MPSNTIYKPAKITDFEAGKLRFNAQGVTTIITAGQTQNLDYILVDDCLITGIWLLTSGGKFGDTACLQVVDTNGIMGVPPGTVLNQFVTNWIMPPTTNNQFDVAYPAKVYAGLSLRLIYTSTADSGDVSVAVNYKLHKVLI